MSSCKVSYNHSLPVAQCVDSIFTQSFSLYSSLATKTENRLNHSSSAGCPFFLLCFSYLFIYFCKGTMNNV